MEFPSIDRSFFLGDCFDAYRTLGSHPFRDGWRFAVWAPSAVAVEICGGFDGWGPGVPMQRAETGIWNGFVPGLQEGEMYKFRIHGRDGSTVMRADPLRLCHRAAPRHGQHPDQTGLPVRRPHLDGAAGQVPQPAPEISEVKDRDADCLNILPRSWQIVKRFFSF